MASSTMSRSIPAMSSLSITSAASRLRLTELATAATNTNSSNARPFQRECQRALRRTFRSPVSWCKRAARPSATERQPGIQMANQLEPFAAQVSVGVKAK